MVAKVVCVAVSSALVACGPSYSSIVKDMERKERAADGKKEQDCRSGADPSACFMAGNAYETGKNRPRSEDKALEVWILGCKHGDSMSCTSIGTLTSRMMETTPGATARTYGIYEDLCRAGSMHACARQATFLRDGKGVAKDAAAAGALYEKVCFGYALEPRIPKESILPVIEARTACSMVNIVRRSGEAPAKDEAKADEAQAHEKLLGARVELIQAEQKVETDRQNAEAKAAAAAAETQAAASRASSASEDDDGNEPTKKSAGKRGTAGKTGSGWGMGMSRDLACADAKLKGTSAAGCDNLGSAVGGAACDCNKVGTQWQCTTTVTCR